MWVWMRVSQVLLNKFCLTNPTKLDLEKHSLWPRPGLVWRAVKEANLSLVTKLVHMEQVLYM